MSCNSDNEELKMDFVILIQAKKKGERDNRMDIKKYSNTTREEALKLALDFAIQKWPPKDGYSGHSADLNK